MAKKAREEFDLTRVIFVPCYQSPFKGTTTATGEQRYRMLQIAIEETGWTWAQVSDFEIARPGPSFSWKTAEHFFKQNPGAELNWILGSDQWEVIEQWAQPDRLRDLLNFIVVKRGKSSVMPRENWRYRKLDFDHPASSSTIRDDIDGNADYLTADILKFCRERKLYSAREVKA